MKRWVVIAFILFAPVVGFCVPVDTTANPPVFYERGPDGAILLFYDDHYYLVDRDCEFKAIERMGRYDFQQQTFIGEFSDFDNHGRLILEGSYVDGKKQGDFSAYHPNGRLKWQVSYMRGNPHGSLSFFYPDGKPLLEIAYSGESTRILNFWDRRGRQRVTEGSGRYEFTIAADGYNEFGYTHYSRSGRVVNGQPHGNWTIKYVFADGKKINAGYEYYNKGRFVLGYETYTNEEFSDMPRYGLLPMGFSARADAMLTKSCTIDDYTGFTEFLAEYVSEWFEGVLVDPVKIEFNVTVKATGEPRGIKMKSSFDNKETADLLFEALNSIGYWLPSYAGGTYIEDKLTVTMEVFPDVRNNKMRFYELKIKRERGI